MSSRETRALHEALSGMGHPLDRADAAVDYCGAVALADPAGFNLSELARLGGLPGEVSRRRDRFRHLIQRSEFPLVGTRRALLASALAEGVEAIAIEIEPIVAADQSGDGTAGRDIVSLSALGEGPPMPLSWSCLQHPPADHLEISDADRDAILDLLDLLILDCAAIKYDGPIPLLVAESGEFFCGEDEGLLDALAGRHFEYALPVRADFTGAEPQRHPFEGTERALTLAEHLDPDDPERALRPLEGAGGLRGEFVMARSDGSFLVIRPELGLGPDVITGPRARVRAEQLGGFRFPDLEIARTLPVAALQGVTPEGITRHGFLVSVSTAVSENRFATGGR